MKALLVKAVLMGAITLLLYGLTMAVLVRVRFHGRSLLSRSGDYYYYKGGNTLAKFRELDRTRRYDAIVVGSSHAQNGYDPRCFQERGLSMFNLGTSSQSPRDSYQVIDHYADAKHCGLVIMDLYENTIGSNGMEATSDLTRNIDDEAAAVDIALALKDPRALNLLALRWLSVDDVPRPVKDGYRAGGFFERADSVKGVPHFPPPRPLHVDPGQLEYLRKCMALCQRRKVPLLFTTHYSPDTNDRARHAEFHALIEREIAGTGVRYIDLAYAHHADPRHHFFDQNHLNAAGVRLFDAQLLDTLQALAIIPRN